MFIRVSKGRWLNADVIAEIHTFLKESKEYCNPAAHATEDILVTVVTKRQERIKIEGDADIRLFLDDLKAWMERAVA